MANAARRVEDGYETRATAKSSPADPTGFHPMPAGDSPSPMLDTGKSLHKRDSHGRMWARLPYPVLCAVLGLLLGWAPMLVHGPIPEKYNLHYIQGAVAVWAWYNARLLIGLFVGITAWPARWYLRGPLCGLILLVPLGFVSLATPECGAPCMFYNCSTASLVGLAVGGIAFALTGRHHLYDEPKAGS